MACTEDAHIFENLPSLDIPKPYRAPLTDRDLREALLVSTRSTHADRRQQRRDEAVSQLFQLRYTSVQGIGLRLDSDAQTVDSLLRTLNIRTWPLEFYQWAALEIVRSANNPQMQACIQSLANTKSVFHRLVSLDRLSYKMMLDTLGASSF